MPYFASALPCNTLHCLTLPLPSYAVLCHCHTILPITLPSPGIASQNHRIASQNPRLTSHNIAIALPGISTPLHYPTSRFSTQLNHRLAKLNDTIATPRFTDQYRSQPSPDFTIQYRCLALFCDAAAIQCPASPYRCSYSVSSPPNSFVRIASTIPSYTFFSTSRRAAST